MTNAWSADRPRRICVKFLHRLPGTLPTLTSADCCPSAADATNGMQSLAMSDAGQLASPGLASRGSGSGRPVRPGQGNASPSLGRATVASTDRSHPRPPWSAVRAAESTLKRTAGERFGCGTCPLVAGRWCCGGASGSGAVVSPPAGVWTWTEWVAAIGPRIVLTERTRAEACWRVGKDAHAVAAVARDLVGIACETAPGSAEQHTPTVTCDTEASLRRMRLCRQSRQERQVAHNRWSSDPALTSSVIMRALVINDESATRPRTDAVFARR